MGAYLSVGAGLLFGTAPDGGYVFRLVRGTCTGARLSPWRSSAGSRCRRPRCFNSCWSAISCPSAVQSGSARGGHRQKSPQCTGRPHRL